MGKVTVAQESSISVMIFFQIPGRSRSIAIMLAPSSLRSWNGPIALVAPRRTKYSLERSQQDLLRTTSLMASPQSGSMVPYCTQRSIWSMRSWPSSTVSLPVWKHLYGTLMLNSLGLPFLPLTVCVKNDPDFLARASLKLIVVLSSAINSNFSYIAFSPFSAISIACFCDLAETTRLLRMCFVYPNLQFLSFLTFSAILASVASMALAKISFAALVVLLSPFLLTGKTTPCSFGAGLG
mmetsp:Transcript_5582/g.12982  ORF Transcript_5582/g.12982 Transcript_5582/m.12982 type:complete len:238 (+) Transcript_5582:2238-2951(+)